MSVKRQATSELNRDNWDDEDPADDKDMGHFKTASKDELEKRVIRTARRKNPMAAEGNKNVFSGFGGFNKSQPSSFDFLANLTNGSKTTNGSTGTNSSETSATPGLFSNKPPASSSGIFGAQTPLSSPSTMASPFASSVKSSPSMLFSTPKADSTKETPFKIQSVSSSTQMETKFTAQTTTSTMMSSPFPSSVKNSPSTLFSIAKADSSKETPFKIQSVSGSIQMESKIPAQTTPSVFGVSSNLNQAIIKAFSSTNSTFKMPPASSNTTVVQTSFGAITTPAVTSVTPEKKTDDSNKHNENKIKYFSKLKGLNEAVSDWINKHIAQTPLCILSPIFKDYEKYLKDITEEYYNTKTEKEKNSISNSGATPKSSTYQDTKTPSQFGSNNKSETNKMASSPFAINNTTLGTQSTKTSTPFSMNSSSSSSETAKVASPFALNNSGSGQTSQNAKTSSPFAINNVGSSLTSPNTKTQTSQDTKTSPFAMNNIGSSSSTPNTKNTLFGNNYPISFPSNKQDTKTTHFGLNNESSPFGSNLNATPKPLFGAQSLSPSLFGAQTSSPENKQPSFSFGIKTSTANAPSVSTPNAPGLSTPNAPGVSTPSAGFSFKMTPATTSATSSPFSLSTNAPGTNQTSTAPFSFSNERPFSFSPNTVQKTTSEPASAENEDEEPPKVEYTPLKEDNSVYEKKCKIFFKKDGNFVDKGVGTLYIKKIEGNVKHQLLVRANTNLGTVLLNLVLAEAIPTQRMGKNNVMLVCIPTPDAKPPPTPVLIRVKTGEEADELLETLNKYKA